MRICRHVLWQLVNCQWWSDHVFNLEVGDHWSSIICSIRSSSFSRSSTFITIIQFSSADHSWTSNLTALFDSHSSRYCSEFDREQLASTSVDLGVTLSFVSFSSFISLTTRWVSKIMSSVRLLDCLIAWTTWQSTLASAYQDSRSQLCRSRRWSPSSLICVRRSRGWRRECAASSLRSILRLSDLALSSSSSAAWCWRQSVSSCASSVDTIFFDVWSLLIVSEKLVDIHCRIPVVAAADRPEAPLTRSSPSLLDHGFDLILHRADLQFRFDGVDVALGVRVIDAELFWRLNEQMSAIAVHCRRWLRDIDENCVILYDGQLLDRLAHIFHAWCRHFGSGIFLHLLASNCLRRFSVLGGDDLSVWVFVDSTNSFARCTYSEVVCVLTSGRRLTMSSWARSSRSRSSRMFFRLQHSKSCYLLNCSPSS